MNGKLRLSKFIIYPVLVVFLIISCTSITYAMFVDYASLKDNSANVAKFGNVELKEHKPIYNRGIYELSKEVISAGYSNYIVLPGVDIAKDPFLVLSGNFDVSYKLYLKISKNLSTITFSIDEGDGENQGWSLVENTTDTYIFNGDIEFDNESKRSKEINIIKDKKLYVSDKYYGENFEIQFSAWIEQVR